MFFREVPTLGGFSTEELIYAEGLIFGILRYMFIYNHFLSSLKALKVVIKCFF